MINKAEQTNLNTKQRAEIYTLPKRSRKKVDFLHEIINEIYLETSLREFKQYFAEAAKYCRDHQSSNVELIEQTQTAFRNTISYLNHLLYHSGNRFNPDQKKQIGAWAHQEFIAFCQQGTWSSRGLRKPQNIAGDHHTIKQIYQGGDQEKRDIGHLVNYCFLQEPACKAVVNRKNYIKRKILDKISKNGGVTTHITSIASGPAEEIFDAYLTLGQHKRCQLKAIGIDKDKRACAYVDDRINRLKLQNHFSTTSVDVLKLGSYLYFSDDNDLVYSMGLIDYFKDRATIKIINNIHDLLKPGGELILGNFHVKCDSRVFLDYILDWPLIYRTEDDMRQLFAKSKFNDSPVTIDFEEEGTNMLVRCIKQ